MAYKNGEYEMLAAAAATGSGVDIPRGPYVFAAAGTFGGTTIGLQMLGPDGATWIVLKDPNGAIALTAADAIYLDLPEGTYRASVTGGTPSDLYADLRLAG